MTINKEYMRSAIFGFEDALASTTGVVVGISTGTSNKDFIILAAIVTIMVEAISMAAGQFLSERTLEQMERKTHSDNLTLGAIIMFVSYFLGGIIPISPIVLFSLPMAAGMSLLFSLLGLFALGYIKGKVVRVSPTRSAFEMLIIGGVAALIGVITGSLLRI